MELNEVFVAGGQPTITYVERADDDIQESVKRAIDTPNQVVSLSGPSKIGKTVLCRNCLLGREYVWVDGGRVSTEQNFWELICSELSISSEETTATETSTQVGIEGGVPFALTMNGSAFETSTIEQKRKVDTMNAAVANMVKYKIIMVIDDFHYIDPEVRKRIVRNIKGPVFNGLKVILLSANHRVFDVIKAEGELTGRFISSRIPEWKKSDLIKIPQTGYAALNVNVPKELLAGMVEEAQSNPMLIQRFCWELCKDLKIEEKKLLGKSKVPEDYDMTPAYKRISRDAGLPIYQRLKSGPQARKQRMMRPKKGGGEVDIYEAILLAVARTGPKSEISYDELRAQFPNVLEDLIPQKHEVTSALKHLTKISQTEDMDSAFDWDESTSLLSVTAPYLRFFLRWQIAKK